MKTILNTYDTDFKNAKNWDSISKILNGGIAVDNMRGQIITGITSAVINSPKLFPHKQGASAIGGIALIGDVYIYQVDANNIDIRSSGVNTMFKVMLLTET